MNNDIHKTPRELLSRFYEKYNLQEDGGFSDNKVKIEFSKHFYFYLPNWDDRRKALIIHDMHHLITGYKSDFKGETEISSWELASGCRQYRAAWILDIYGMTWGAWFNLPGIFKAWVRGRRSQNLYHETLGTEKAMDMTIVQIQNALNLPPVEEDLKATLSDVATFIICLALGGLFDILSIALIPFLVLYNIYIFTFHRNPQTIS